MAVTQEQVNEWFAANPTATADQVAAAVQSVGGLEANAGLSGMIADRYDIGQGAVDQYYNNYAIKSGGPEAYNTVINDWFSGNNAETAGGLPTTAATQANMEKFGVTGDDIFTATGRTLDQLNPTLTSSDNKTYEGNVLLNLVRQLGANTSVNDLSGSAYGVTNGNIGFDYTEANKLFGNSNATQQVFLDAARGLLDRGITDLSQLSTKDIMGEASVQPEVDANGNPTGRYIATWGGDSEGLNSQSRVLTPEEAARVTSSTVTSGDSESTQYTPVNIALNKGIFDKNGNQISGTNQLDLGSTYTGTGGTSYTLTYDPTTGKPAFKTTGFSTSDADALGPLVTMASLAFPAIAPYLQAGMSAYNLGQGNYTGALLSGLSAAGGFGSAGASEIDALANAGNSAGAVSLYENSPLVQNLSNINLARTGVAGLDALNRGNVSGVINAGMSGLNQLGMGATLPSGLTTIAQGANLVSALTSNNVPAALNVVGDLIGSNDTKVAASALNVLNLLNNPNADPTALMNAVTGLSRTIGSTNNTTTTSGLTGTKVSDAGDVNLPSGLQLASSNNGTISDAGSNLIEVSGTPIFADSSRASNVRPPAGYTLASQDDPVMQETARYDDNDRPLPKSDGTYYDITQNAWFKPTGEFDLSNLTASLDGANETVTGATLPSDFVIDTTGALGGGDASSTSGLDSVNSTNLALNSNNASNLSNASNANNVTSGLDSLSGDGVDELTITGDRPVKVLPTDDNVDELTITGDRPTKVVATDTTVVNNDDGTTTTVVVEDDGTVKTHECLDGFHWDEAAQACVANEKPIVCGEGFTLSADGKSCVPIVKTDGPLVCGDGFTLSADGKSCIPITTVVTPPVVVPPVVPPKTTTSPLSSAGSPAQKLDSSEQMLRGAPAQKRMELAKLQQLFASLTPELAAVLSERGFQPPKYKEDKEDKKEDKSEKEDKSVFGNLSDELYNPSSRFMASGGSVLDSMKPKYVESAKFLAAAPVHGSSGMDSPLKLAVIKHLKQAISAPPRSMEGLAQGGLPTKYAKAAPKGHKPEFITGLTGYYAQGEGTGQSDDIPAMLHDGDYVIDADAVAALGDGSSKAGAQALSQFQSKIPHEMSSGGEAVPAKIADGEYVFPATFVSAIGGGDNKLGAKRLDAMREELRAHKRSAPTSKIPPKAKSPLDYLRMAKG
jgi:hypothetical protein